MNSTFSRAVVGFVILTLALGTFSYAALWVMDVYTPTLWQGYLLVIILGLVIEIGIFLSTLYEPLYDWITEPKKAAKRRSRTNALYDALNNIYDAANSDVNKFVGVIGKELWEPARLALVAYNRQDR